MNIDDRLPLFEWRRWQRCLCLVGAVLALQIMSRVSANDEPPGLLIDVGGFRLHIACQGYGSPTVISDVGLGGTSLEWIAVSREVRKFTRICTYDRAGYGWSDPGPLPRTSSRIANELFVLLDSAGLDGPFLLVGHSYGGFNMQLFARRYPYLTAGIVLVDSSHPSQVERFLAPPIGLNTAPSTSFGIVQFAGMPQPHASLPKEVRALARIQPQRWRWRRTLADELLSFRDSARELRESQPLAPMPMAVVSRGKRVWPQGRRGDLIEQLWIDMQTELALQSPHSVHIVARDSGHFIHLDQPKLVAYGIALLTDTFRNNSVDGQYYKDPEGPPEPILIDFSAGTWYRDSLGSLTAFDTATLSSHALTAGAP